MGRIDDARRSLEMLRERARNNPQLSLEFDFVTLLTALGQLDDVFPLLEAAARKRLAEVLFSVNGYMWDDLRQDPRYWQILERHGLHTIARQRPAGRQ